MKNVLKILFIIFLNATIYANIGQTREKHCIKDTLVNSNDTIGEINVLLGLPTDDNDDDDYVIRRKQYVLSFNKNLKVCNWVSWNLNRDWFGDAKRYHKFIKDTEVDEDFQANDKDYRKSGYDKGHVVRSEERTATQEDNITTFYYTNILPQKPELNRKVWYELEKYCEKLCKTNDKELFIIAGGIFVKDYKTIGNEIAVPDSCFKIIVILDKGQRLEDVNYNTEIIAVVIPNNNSFEKRNWESYKTNVKRIEYSTGYNFLNNINNELQETLENKIYGNKQ